MKYTLKTPCKECPFRKASLPGWLGPSTGNPEKYARYVLGSVEIEPEVYVGGEPNDTACHLSINNWLNHHKSNSDTVPTKHEHELEHCAGALHFLGTSCKQPRDSEKADAIDKVMENTKEPMIKHLPEFLTHHRL